MAPSLAGACAPGVSLDAQFLEFTPDFASLKQEDIYTFWMRTTRSAASSFPFSSSEAWLLVGRLAISATPASQVAGPNQPPRQLTTVVPKLTASAWWRGYLYESISAVRPEPLTLEPAQEVPEPNLDLLPQIRSPPSPGKGQVPRACTRSQEPTGPQAIRGNQATLESQAF